MLVCLLDKFTTCLASVYAVCLSDPALSVLVGVAVVVVLQEVEAIVSPVYPVLIYSVVVDVAAFVSAAALKEGRSAYTRPVKDVGKFGVRFQVSFFVIGPSVYFYHDVILLCALHSIICVIHSI